MVGVAQGDDERLPAGPDEIAKRFPDRGRRRRDLDLIDGHAVAVVVQHLIEELGQRRVQSEGTCFDAQSDLRPRPPNLAAYKANKRPGRATFVLKVPVEGGSGQREAEARG